MEAANASETSKRTYYPTRCNNAEDYHLSGNRDESLKNKQMMRNLRWFSALYPITITRIDAKEACPALPREARISSRSYFI